MADTAFGLVCFVVKRNVSDNAKTICNNAQFISIAEISIDIYLPDSGIGGDMGRHRVTGGFIRIVRIIKVMEIF